jgi:hypothetical protein
MTTGWVIVLVVAFWIALTCYGIFVGWRMARFNRSNVLRKWRR